MWCELFQHGRLGVVAFHRVEGPVNVGRDGDGGPLEVEFLEEGAERCVRGCDDFGMERVGGLQNGARHAFCFKRGHRGLHRLGFAGDDGHLRRVLVGGDDVTVRGLKDALNVSERCADRSHQALIVNFNRAHFGATGSGRAKGAVHVHDAGRHQGRVFAKRMACDHVGFEAVIVEGTLDGQIGRQHGRLGVFGPLELRFSVLDFFLGQVASQHKGRERLAVQHLNHGLVSQTPDVLNRREALPEVVGHPNVLAALTGVHVGDFGLGGHGGLVGDHHALGRKEAPTGGIGQG